MKLLRLFGAAALAFVLAGAPVAANPPNVLDAYVARADPSFAWRVEKTFTGEGYHGAVLELTSQTWLSASQTDRSVWKHWLTITVPDKVSRDKALLYIGGGDNTDPAPAGPSDRFAAMAIETNSVIAELGQVPNQPMHFPDSPDKARVEDDIIAKLQSQYDKDRNPEALLHLPMVKSGTAAMTAIQQYLTSEAGGKLKVDGFVVAGGSKRGWTTWLVGLLDARVVGMMPLVINVLDVEATTRHHWEAMGYFSPALQDYVDHGLIPAQIGTPRLSEVNRIEDPLNYRDRPRMKIPKYVINAVGDEYFPPDNTRFSYPLLPGEKRLRMIPNSKHSTSGTDISESMTAWYDAVIAGRTIPDFSWRVQKDGAIVVAGAQSGEVRLWQATNPKARDFRVDTIGKAFTSEVVPVRANGTHRLRVAPPKEGFTAYLVEVTFPSGGKYPFKFTSEVYVTPDVLPYRWKDARPITAPPK